MYRYFVSYAFMSRSGASRFGNFEIRRETPIAGHEDIAELNQTIKENISAQPNGDIVITNFIRFEDATTRYLPAGDIEQLVADIENKIDPVFDDDLRSVFDDLLYRLRALAGLDTSGYPGGPVVSMLIGRTDRCLIETPHDVSFCGKLEAHR